MRDEEENKASAGPFPFFALPQDIQQYILWFSAFSLQDIRSVAAACKTLHQQVNRDPNIWKTIFKRHFSDETLAKAPTNISWYTAFHQISAQKYRDLDPKRAHRVRKLFAAVNEGDVKSLKKMQEANDFSLEDLKLKNNSQKSLGQLVRDRWKAVKDAPEDINFKRYNDLVEFLYGLYTEKLQNKDSLLYIALQLDRIEALKEVINETNINVVLTIRDPQLALHVSHLIIARYTNPILHLAVQFNCALSVMKFLLELPGANINIFII